MRILGVLTTLFFAGCTAQAPYAEFTKTTEFSRLQRFSYKDTLVPNRGFREFEKEFLKKISEQTIIRELEARDFTLDEKQADFYVVVKWRKAINHDSDFSGTVDEVSSIFSQSDNLRFQFDSRIQLVVEFYGVLDDELFWRDEVQDMWHPIQFTEKRIVPALKYAIKHFPDRIGKSPDLLDIE